jgi:hypothetical protein
MPVGGAARMTFQVIDYDSTLSERRRTNSLHGCSF